MILRVKECSITNIYIYIEIWKWRIFQLLLYSYAALPNPNHLQPRKLTMAMEKQPFEGVSPTKSGDVRLSC